MAHYPYRVNRTLVEQAVPDGPKQTVFRTLEVLHTRGPPGRIITLQDFHWVRARSVFPGTLPATLAGQATFPLVVTQVAGVEYNTLP